MESYENFIRFLNSKKDICIVGKGITSQNYDEKEYDLYIGVKQSILLLKQKDILVMNDFEGVFGCEDIFKELKYIVCPYYPHLRTRPSPDLTYKSIQTYAKKCGFKGKIVIYNNNIKNIIIPKLLNVMTFSSGDIIFNFLNLCSNKKNMNIGLYGIGLSNIDNPLIIELMLKNHKKNKVNQMYNEYLMRRYTKPTGDNTNSKSNLKRVRGRIRIFKSLNITFN